MVSKIAKARQQLILKNHIDNPTDHQISDSMGLDVKKVALYSQVARSHASLEDPGDSNALGGHQGEEDCLADVIQDYNPTADDLLMKVGIMFILVHPLWPFAFCNHFLLGFGESSLFQSRICETEYIVCNAMLSAWSNNPLSSAI